MVSQTQPREETQESLRETKVLHAQVLEKEAQSSCKDRGRSPRAVRGRGLLLAFLGTALMGSHGGRGRVCAQGRLANVNSSSGYYATGWFLMAWPGPGVKAGVLPGGWGWGGHRGGTTLNGHVQRVTGLPLLGPLLSLGMDQSQEGLSVPSQKGVLSCQSITYREPEVYTVQRHQAGVSSAHSAGARCWGQGL